MAKAYVETTVLTDALLKPGSRALTATATIRSFEESLLPVYAIKEMKAGPLHHYVWLHGKLVTTNSWSKTLEQLRKMATTPRRYWVSSAVEALEAAANKHKSTTLASLVKKYGESAKDDVVLCDRYRLALRSIIMRAWKQRRKLTSSVVQELDCYGETELVEERGLIELGDVRCKPKRECSLAHALKGNSEALQKLRTALERQEDKLENVKRLRVLKDLIRVPKQLLDEQKCRHLGDAFFAFFCPTDAVILTTNIKDIAPLAGSLGKSAQKP